MKNWRNVTENACWVGKRTPKPRPTFRKHMEFNYSLLFGKRHLAQQHSFKSSMCFSCSELPQETRCHSGCFTRKSRGVSVCVCSSGRRKDRRCERTTDTSSSLSRLHQLQHKNSLFCKLQTEQNPTFGTKFQILALEKNLSSCFDLDFIFTLISNI